MSNLVDKYLNEADINAIAKNYMLIVASFSRLLKDIKKSDIVEKQKAVKQLTKTFNEFKKIGDYINE